MNYLKVYKDGEVLNFPFSQSKHITTNDPTKRMATKREAIRIAHAAGYTKKDGSPLVTQVTVPNYQKPIKKNLPEPTVG